MRDDRKTGPKPGTPQALGKLEHRIIATVREPLIVLDGDLRVISANDSFYRTFKVLRRWTEGRLIFEIGKRQWDIPRLRILLENILLNDQHFQDFEVEQDFPKIGRRTMLLNARRLTGGLEGNHDPHPAGHRRCHRAQAAGSRTAEAFSGATGPHRRTGGN